MNMTGDIILPIIDGESSTTLNPHLFDQLIGQDAARKKLAFLIAAHSPDTPFPTLLLNGSKGLGKTFFSGKVADALGRRFIEVNSATLKQKSDFVEDILFDKVVGKGDSTLLLDEAHALGSDVSDLLLSFLNPNPDNVNFVDYKGWKIKYDFFRINIILATTEAHKVCGPLVNRCEEIYFHLYSEDELLRILKLYTNGTTFDCSRKELAMACRGRGRDTYKLAKNIQRACQLYKKKVITPRDWEELKSILGIHRLGLRTQEVRLMKMLAKCGPISCKNLAIRLGVNENNVESELEVRPRELGLITNDSRGRFLTKEGERYLDNVIITES